MSHIRIDKVKAMKKWSPVLENMGVTGEDRLDWMSEYAEYHSINENAYLNAGIAGMGGVVSPNPGALAGALNAITATSPSPSGNIGSGDLAQNLLPVAMKIAAQTIGLDLVAVKPTPGPKIDLLYIDFQYDDVDTAEARPQVFKVNCTPLATVIAGLTAAMAYTGGGAVATTQTVGGLQGGRIWVDISTGAYTKAGEPEVKTKKVEFLGFSRVDGLPMFRAYNQANARSNATVYGGVGVAPYQFDTAKNTFGPTSSMTAQIEALGGTAVSNVTVQLISALEDHIPGFVSNWTAATDAQTGLYPMSRANDDLSYAGVIGPKVSSKSVAVGTIEVSSALRRTEIEDIKANTGMDIVQKMESILVNELSQTISKQIVAKVFELGAANRLTAPAFGGSATISGHTVFDLDTAYASSSGPGGETTHAVQRKLITKLVHASNYIATEGRVGPAQYAVTNGGLAAAFMDIAGYTINPVKSKINGSGQLYPVGQIGDITIYVDPYMRYNDNRIALGRKNNPDQPGLIFVPYLMAQSISVISEATFAPRMLLRSRYAVAEVGWFPQKQYMEIKVLDANSYLN